MRLAALAVGFTLLLGIAYRFYGRWVARQLGLDDGRTTPAHTKRDGVDFVPTRPFYLFGQHFSAIAAAGPIAGPILACLTFGWLPCLLWIALGVVLIGAVHDLTSLFASVRHGAQSIAEIARQQLGRRAGLAMMGFIWIALVYVIVAFADITAASFVSGTEELAGAHTSFNPGGAVAAASAMYLLLAVIMGLVQRFLAPPLWLITAIFVPLSLGASWLGTSFSNVFVFERSTWGLMILGYCAVASVVPVWALLQPRGYLGGFVLYTALALGVVGVLFGGYEIQQPAFRGWDTGGATGMLFPFLFVTIACGACSGFHGLVCSGTTSKQIDRESHARPVGYGAMLAEAVVALIALVTVMIASNSEVAGLAPGTVYGNGMGRFLTLLIGDERREFAVTFGAMAFSTFVFDTLDVSLRLGRYLVQELLGWSGRLGAVMATLLTLAFPVCLVLTAGDESWRKFWTLFGASNQLLAALTLLTLAVWLRSEGRRVSYVVAPMVVLFTLTLWALGRLGWSNLRASQGADVALINAVAAAALIALAVFVIGSAVRVARQGKQAMRISGLLVLAACGVSAAAGAAEPGSPDRAGAAACVLDDWHAAAAAADETRYFGHFTADAVFLGTDGTERWSVEQFRNYAHPHFAEGRGWTYVPSERHVVLAPCGTLAWFDEQLHSEKYGELRGTGVLRRIGKTWKIAHYSMTFVVPNAVARDVVERIGGRATAP